MSKNILITIILSSIIIIMGLQYLISKSIDTKYAKKYAEIFGGYDINEVDKYLNNETLIEYKGITKPYKELRHNVITAFAEKEYEMQVGSSYGNGDDQFDKGVQVIGLQVYIKSDDFSSDYVQMEIERHWFFFYKIKSLKSDDNFFGYLFYGLIE